MIFFTLTFAIILAAQDIKTRHVSIFVAAAYLISLMPYANSSTDSMMAALMIGLALSWPLTKKWLAPIDFTFLVLSPLLIELENLPILFLALGVLSFSYHLISKERNAPFLAFYVAVFMPMLLWQWR